MADLGPSTRRAASPRSDASAHRPGTARSCRGRASPAPSADDEVNQGSAARAPVEHEHRERHGDQRQARAQPEDDRPDDNHRNHHGRSAGSRVIPSLRGQQVVTLSIVVQPAPSDPSIRRLRMSSRYAGELADADDDSHLELIGPVRAGNR